MIIELGGTQRGTEYDAVDVAGTLFLDGTLDIRLIDGFVPSPGDTFQILSYGWLEGDFQQYSLPPLPPAMSVEFDFVQGNLIASVGVPEPETLGMLAVGLFALITLGRRARRAFRSRQ